MFFSFILSFHLHDSIKTWSSLQADSTPWPTELSQIFKFLNRYLKNMLYCVFFFLKTLYIGSSEHAMLWFSFQKNYTEFICAILVGS